VFKLIEAFDRVMKAAKVEIPHEVLVERTSITDAIGLLADKLRESPQLSFFALFEGQHDRGQMVALFLAILEMTRLKLIKLLQELPGGDIVVRTASGKVLESAPEVEDEFR
jgi:segregation and condensation protein A